MLQLQIISGIIQSGPFKGAQEEKNVETHAKSFSHVHKCSGTLDRVPYM
jgi:hypothetical protein